MFCRRLVYNAGLSIAIRPMYRRCRRFGFCSSFRFLQRRACYSYRAPSRRCRRFGIQVPTGGRGKAGEQNLRPPVGASLPNLNPNYCCRPIERPTVVTFVDVFDPHRLGESLRLLIVFKFKRYSRRQIRFPSFKSFSTSFVAVLLGIASSLVLLSV